MNDDWFDMLVALLVAEARFLVVGAHALAVHGHPRATQDIDVWIDPSPENGRRVWRAMIDFGAPMHDLDITEADLSTSGLVVQLGLPPNRIDLLTSITGVPDFDAAFEQRVTRPVRGRDIPFIGRDALLQNKRATGRTKDMADAELLEGEDSSQ